MTENGKRMPLDPEATKQGNVWVIRMEEGTPIVGVAAKPADVPQQEALRYVSHFATCPQATDWRKQRGPGAEV